jgi:hypothetical protein
MVPVGSTGMGSVTLGDSQYAVSMENYRSVEQPTVADLSETQRQALFDEVEAASIEASQVQGQNLGSAFVYGEITDFRRNSQTVSLQLSGANVWVPVGAVQSPQNFVGRTLYLQGRVQSDASGETTVQYRTIGQFPMVGFAALDAVVPPHRFTRHQATVQVYKNGNQIANGQAGLRNNALYGSVSEIYIQHGLLKDTYVAPQQVQTLQGGTPAMYISVKEVPLMNGVRLGIAVMLIGGFLIWRFDRGEAEDWD